MADDTAALAALVADEGRNEAANEDVDESMSDSEDEDANENGDEDGNDDENEDGDESGDEDGMDDATNLTKDGTNDGTTEGVREVRRNRKGHKKSRNGCRECKRLRQKVRSKTYCVFPVKQEAHAVTYSAMRRNQHVVTAAKEASYAIIPCLRPRDEAPNPRLPTSGHGRSPRPSCAPKPHTTKRGNRKSCCGSSIIVSKMSKAISRAVPPLRSGEKEKQAVWKRSHG